VESVDMRNRLSVIVFDNRYRTIPAWFFTLNVRHFHYRDDVLVFDGFDFN
jgi:hypothetical protein